MPAVPIFFLRLFLLFKIGYLEILDGVLWQANLCVLQETFTCSWKTILVNEQKAVPSNLFLPAFKI
jgi:hypothetical protein